MASTRPYSLLYASNRNYYYTQNPLDHTADIHQFVEVKPRLGKKMRRSRITHDTAQVMKALNSRRTRSAVTAPKHVAEQEPQQVTVDDIVEPRTEESTITTESGSTVTTLSGAGKKRRYSAVEKAITTTTSAPTTATVTAKFPRKARRQPAKPVVHSSDRKNETGIKLEPPANWEEMYTLTRQMRNAQLAPVDTMGCESLALETAPPQVQRFQTLVALMLSSQTKDTVTAAAMRTLQTTLPGGLALQSILDVPADELNEMIGKVGFHNTKTKHIKAVAPILRDQYGGDIPDTVEGLVALPGVGPKMAYLCMSAAWGRDEGIGVDVHVHRITNLWGWHPKPTKNPEETRALLESWLPRDKWHDINNLLVGFGQTICTPVGRKCTECLLAEHGLCPSAALPKGSTIAINRAVKKEETVDGGQLQIEETSNVKIKDEDIEDTFLPLRSDTSTQRTRQARKRP